MQKRTSGRPKTSDLACKILGLLVAIGLFLPSVGTSAQPVGIGMSFSSSERIAADEASIFNWTEVPANQEVVITRATFDEGGYQLYDTVGETIIVPFHNHDLYAMKFARSSNGSMYFVNTGSTPILYVPSGGYLENASDSGAHWYPFSEHFHPDYPVYVSIAPSWNDYCDMGWYRDCDFYGGYWCDRPHFDPGIYIATAGFAILIGDVWCHGWWPYYHYCHYHHPWFHTQFWNPAVYRYAARPLGGRQFRHMTFAAPFGRTAAWSHRTFSGRAVAGGSFRQFGGTRSYIAAHGVAAARAAHAGGLAAAGMAGHMARLAAHNRNVAAHNARAAQNRTAKARMAAAHRTAAARNANARMAAAHRTAAARNANARTAAAHRTAAARNANARMAAAHRTAAARNANARMAAAHRTAAARNANARMAAAHRTARTASAHRTTSHARVATRHTAARSRVAARHYGGNRVASRHYGGGARVARRSGGFGGGQQFMHRTSGGGSARSFRSFGGGGHGGGFHGGGGAPHFGGGGGHGGGGGFHGGGGGHGGGGNRRH